MRKQMEGDAEQRRQKAREARERGKQPSAVGATTGASKQRHHEERSEDHFEKVEDIRRGKQKVISEATPKPRPRSGSKIAKRP